MDFSQVGSLVVVGAVLGLVGRQISKLVFQGKPKMQATGWRKVFYRSMWAHPVVAGMVLALAASSLPAPEYLGDGLAGRVIWYALAGGWSHSIVKIVDAMFKKAPPPS